MSTASAGPLVALGDGPLDIADLPGRLIVIEGTDGVGRSTQLALLREYLEKRGFGVVHTAQARSALAADGLRRAKEGHTLGRATMDLFYATDFVSRLEGQILPALRAGFVVLTDRYVYSMIARCIVRGGPEQWIEDVYQFAPRPHAVFYLKATIESLLPRVLSRGGFDYWESGMDHLEESDLHHAFVRYQTTMLEVFDSLAVRFDFQTIDANRPVESVFADLRAGVLDVVSDMQGAAV
ncbi:MAG: thymidylate kinase [Planctomycetota bacterium]